MAKGKQQHAHGAVTPKEWEEVRELLNGDLFLGPFDHSRSRKALDAVFAKRPASYTLEQIMSAGETVAAHLPNSRDRADFRMHLRDVYARLQPMPKLKTPEERVTVELGTTTYDLRSGGMTWEPAATPATGVEQVHAPKTIVPEPDQRRIETERFP